MFCDDVGFVCLLSVDGVSLVSMFSVAVVLLFYLCVGDAWVGCSER